MLHLEEVRGSDVNNRRTGTFMCVHTDLTFGEVTEKNSSSILIKLEQGFIQSLKQ